MTGATTDRRLGLSGNTAYKAAATAVATTNVTQSGEQTVGGVAVHAINAAGVADRVLCTGQTDATTNGLWDVSTAAWTRSIDANGNYDLAQGSQVAITQGSGASQIWILTTANPITLGATAQAWSQNLSAGFLATLAASSGSSLVGFLQAGIGAVARLVLGKLQERVSVFDFMTSAQVADYQAQTFTLDHTAAFNAAVTAVAATGGRLELFLPGGILNLTSTIASTSAISIRGVGHVGQATTASSAANNGTLIRLNHLNQGFTASGAGFACRDLAVYRVQTAPGGGWTPAASNFDFDLSTTDVTLDNILFWGTSQGFRVNSGGRVIVKNILGQFFNYVGQVLVATDVCRISDIQAWPIWSQNSNVQTYMEANTIGLELQRCDGPMIHNFFTEWMKKSLRFVHNASGDTTALKGSNLYFDNGVSGIVVESGTNGVTMQLANVSHQTDPSSPGNGCGVQLLGTNAVVDIANFKSDRSDVSALRNSDGTGNKLRVSNLEMTNWNQGNGGFFGVSCDGTGNEISISGKAQLGSALFGSTAAFGGANQKNGFWAYVGGSGTTGASGLISIPHGLGYTPGSADAICTGNNALVAHYLSADATNVNLVIYNGTSVLNAGAVAVVLRLYY